MVRHVGQPAHCAKESLRLLLGACATRGGYVAGWVCNGCVMGVISLSTYAYQVLARGANVRDADRRALERRARRAQQPYRAAP